MGWGGGGWRGCALFPAASLPGGSMEGVGGGGGCFGAHVTIEQGARWVGR